MQARRKCLLKCLGETWRRDRSIDKCVCVCVYEFEREDREIDRQTETVKCRGRAEVSDIIVIRNNQEMKVFQKE